MHGVVIALLPTAQAREGSTDAKAAFVCHTLAMELYESVQ